LSANDPPPGGASPEVERRLKRLVYYAVPLGLVMATLDFLPIDSEPWVWVKVAVLALGTIVLGVWVTRFTLWQRDEYWRERGRDPEHPERLPNRPAD
jgi:hypothetical protein